MSAPAAPKAPPPPPEPLKQATVSIDKSMEEQRKKAALLANLNDTVKTGGMGLTAPASTAVKSLIGQ